MVWVKELDGLFLVISRIEKRLSNLEGWTAQMDLLGMTPMW